MQPESATDRWIGDYRSLGLCDWPDGLRDALARLRRRTAIRALLWLATPPVIILAAIVAAVLVDRYIPRPRSDGFLIAIIAAAGISIVFPILKLSDQLKQRTGLGRLLQYSHVERFELSQHVRDEVAAAQSLGLDASLENFPVTLFVIPAPPVHPPAPSALVQIDDRALIPPTLVFIRSLPQTSVAPPPPSAAAQGSQPLSPAELDELRRYVADGARALRNFSIIYSILTLGVAAIAAYLALVGKPASAIHWFVIIPAAWLFMTWRRLPPTLKQRPVLERLRLDLDEGRTIVLDGHRAIAELRDAGLLEPGAPVVNPGVVRRLPHSQFWWDVDGVPAAWRR